MEQLSCLLVFAWDGMTNTSLLANFVMSTSSCGTQDSDPQCWSNLRITIAQTLTSDFMRERHLKHGEGKKCEILKSKSRLRD